MRDCKNCKYHNSEGCSQWECNFEPVCKWCYGIEEDNLHIEYYHADYNGDMVSRDDDSYTGSVGIARFCPACGRRLSEG